MSKDVTGTAEVITTGDPRLMTRPPAETTDNFLAIIARAASDPAVDVAKMERLLSMQFQLLDRAREAAFNQALGRLQPKLPTITKSGAIILKDGVTKIAYAKFDDIWASVGPLLAEEGFTVSYTSDLVPSGNLLKITVTLRHSEGHSDSGSVFLPLTDDTGAKNRVQGAGSIYSYGKRYALCQYLNIIAEGEDDDGSGGGMEPISEKQIAELTDMISDSGADEKKFLAYMHVKSLSEIVVRDFKSAKEALLDRKRKVAQGKA